MRFPRRGREARPYNFGQLAHFGQFTCLPLEHLYEELVSLSYLGSGDYLIIKLLSPARLPWNSHPPTLLVSEQGSKNI